MNIFLNLEDMNSVYIISFCLTSLIEAESIKIIQEMSDFFRMNILSNKQQKFAVIKALSSS